MVHAVISRRSRSPSLLVYTRAPKVKGQMIVRLRGQVGIILEYHTQTTPEFQEDEFVTTHHITSRSVQQNEQGLVVPRSF